MKTFLILIMLMIAGEAQAGHDAIKDCHNVQRALEYLRINTPNLALKYDITGDEAQGVIKRYNAEEPVTNHVGDEVAVFWDPTRAEFPMYVLILHQGCAFNGSPATARMVEKLIGRGS